MLARWLYSLIFYLATPLLLLRLRRRAKKNPAYSHRIPERFGQYLSEPCESCLWFHTVSVGEFMAAKPLIDRFIDNEPGCQLLITTMTPTGSDRVNAAYGALIATGSVRHVYLPYDQPGAIKRFLNHFNPSLLVIMETELWPNMLHYTAQRNTPIVVANARLSERSANGYRRIKPLFKAMMRNVKLVAAQSSEDGARFVSLGLLPSRLQVLGSVKFDVEVDAELREQANALRQCWGPSRRVLIAASTHKGEDEQIVEAFLYIRAKIPSALLVIVPRHPERFDAVAELIQQRGLHLARHSTAERVNESTDVVLGDTMGELLKMLGAADVAFMGGSLVPVGGHNMLEPLAMGVPTLTGPHIFNFQKVSDTLEELGVLQTVTSAVGLGDAVVALLENEVERRQLAERGRQVVADNRGAIDRLYALINAQRMTNS